MRRGQCNREIERERVEVAVKKIVFDEFGNQSG